MSERNLPMLADAVRISRLYQRSIRIDVDLGRPDALDGYICHATARGVLESMSRQFVVSNQRAYTWTGPFGGGKSSLAIALASALSPRKQIRVKARKILHAATIPTFDAAFPCKRGWLVLPVVGKRSSVVVEIAKALHRARGARGDPKKIAPGALVEEICSIAASTTWDGVLVLIDEMGKFLEASALGVGDDLNFYQDLAEIGARAKGKVVVVGILHQAFAQYAKRLGVETRDEWAKVQGRYADIPLVAASDEVVELIGRAIETKCAHGPLSSPATAIAASIRARRPTVGPQFAERLARCSPLHPALAALLGPISKRQFGQNERSVFGFLASVEPFGFRAFLHSTPLAEARWYRPDDYWDYLRANLEPAILASPDGHRWAQAVEAIERVEAKSGDSLLVQLVKNVAIVDLFRNGSGLIAENDVLAAIFPEKPQAEIEAALAQLAAMHVLLFKKHIGAWSVFEGSDFDIEAAIGHARAAQASVDFALLAGLANLHPVVAKRHYHHTGTMRWMNMALCRVSEASKLSEAFRPSRAEFGLLLLALPERGETYKASTREIAPHARIRPWPVAIGVPKNHTRIEELSAELVALRQVRNRHELSGDSVARREVHARLADVQASLQEELRAGIAHAHWAAAGSSTIQGAKLTRLASDLADDLYDQAPTAWSELINREDPSSNSVKARRDLMHRMLNNEAEENLGISGFPAERGLYVTLLLKTGLHGKSVDGAWRFKAPGGKQSKTFVGLWQATREMFVDSTVRVSVTAIYARWAAPPFGVRVGLMPVYLTAFLMSNKGNLAIYKDDLYLPQLTDTDIDEYLQDSTRFSLRWIVIDKQKAAILNGVAKLLTALGVAPRAMDPLEAARSLVALVYNLPIWAQRTMRIGQKARVVRDTLLKASDPHKVLFIDLPAALDGKIGAAFVDELRAPLEELALAYEVLIRSIEDQMLQELDSNRGELTRLRARAESLEGLSGNLRQEAFCTRIAKHDGSRESMEGILSLAANKPSHDWNDRDIDAAKLEIAQAALQFRRDEVFVAVKGRKPNTEAIAVVFGAGPETRTVARSFAVPARHAPKIELLANRLVADLRAQDLNVDLMLAALIRTGMKLTEDDDARSRADG